MIRERIQRILDEVGDGSQYRISSWELAFLRDNIGHEYLSEHQQEILREIERKAGRFMNDLLPSRFAIGERVLGLGQPAQVVAVKFTESKVIYEVAFDTGGVNSELDSTYVTNA